MAHAATRAAHSSGGHYGTDDSRLCWPRIEQEACGPLRLMSLCNLPAGMPVISVTACLPRCGNCHTGDPQFLPLFYDAKLWGGCCPSSPGGAPPAQPQLLMYCNIHGPGCTNIASTASFQHVGVGCRRRCTAGMRIVSFGASCCLTRLAPLVLWTRCGFLVGTS